MTRTFMGKLLAMSRLTSFALLGIFLLGSMFTCNAPEASEQPAPQEATPPKVVFIAADEEYRSEESMPMLARILKREMGAEVEVLYSLDSNGIIDPNNLYDIPGLEALDSADLAVFFMRFRELPPKQVKHILDYAESGRPMVGFRTSTHAFLYKQDTMMAHLNNEWPTQIFGQQWITHHGHFADGNRPLTKVTLAGNESPILNGVDSFSAYSWLYHVDGGDWQLAGNPQILLNGHSLRSKHEEEGRLDQFPLDNPVAWTKTYQNARVFFTTLGHPYDFRDANMRKLALNGMYWALGREDQIPAEGVYADPVGDYQPNNSGFGQKYKPDLRPENI